MKAAVASGSLQIADARSPGRFSGAEPEPRAGLRSGHMPGARNVHYARLLEPDGTLKSPEEMVQFYDPTDLFGDLAETIAEQFPEVAPELDDEEA